MILVWVFIYKAAKKVVLALHKKAILRCNQKIAKGICAPFAEKFLQWKLLDSQSFQERLFFPQNFPAPSPALRPGSLSTM
jgi:hypothetical protein